MQPVSHSVVTMAFMGRFFRVDSSGSSRCHAQCPERASERALKKSGNCGPTEGKNWENIIRHFLSVTHPHTHTHIHPCTHIKTYYDEQCRLFRLFDRKFAGSEAVTSKIETELTMSRKTKMSSMCCISTSSVKK